MYNRDINRVVELTALIPHYLLEMHKDCYGIHLRKLPCIRFHDCPVCGALHKTLYKTADGWMCSKCVEKKGNSDNG